MLITGVNGQVIIPVAIQLINLPINDYVAMATPLVLAHNTVDPHPH